MIPVQWLRLNWCQNWESLTLKYIGRRHGAPGGGILTFTSGALFGLLYAVNNAGRVLASIVTVLIAVTMLALARIGWWDFYVIAIVEYCIFIAVFLNIPPVKTECGSDQWFGGDEGRYG